jgi:hypothetical protein
MKHTTSDFILHDGGRLRNLTFLPWSITYRMYQVRCSTIANYPRSTISSAQTCSSPDSLLAHLHLKSRNPYYRFRHPSRCAL